MRTFFTRTLMALVVLGSAATLALSPSSWSPGMAERSTTSPAVDLATPNTGDQRDRGIRTVQAFYESLQAKDIDRFATLWTSDAVYRVPITAECTPGALVGRDTIVSTIGEFFELFGETRFTWEIEPMRDPRRLAATWTLDIQLTTGVRYQNVGVAIIEVNGDRIADFTDYYDTHAFLTAFGVTCP